MTANDIRQKYLDFMKQKGHAIVPSDLLVPQNDPTTLFTGSGMQPMVSYLLGQIYPLGTRVVNSQKCFRAEDIEEVGDNRHTTFFEMLGNWSFGDYFKKEQIEWCFEFLVNRVQLDPNKLYVSVFKGQKSIGVQKDQEAVDIWKSLFQKSDVSVKEVEHPEKDGLISGGRIFYYGVRENWWSRSGVPKNMPVGEPGGPDSEVFYDFGSEHQFHEHSEWKDQPCHPACDCGRFLEIGNNVFMQYVKTKDGFQPLEKKNIDFGGGLERIVAAKNNNPDIFLTDLFYPIVQKLEKLSSQKYQESTQAFRVVADHIRGSVMLIGDGVFPSNKQQGYVLRRILRRAIRKGMQLGIEEPFLFELVPVVVEIYKQAYPDVAQKKKKIQKQIKKEELKFQKTIKKGLFELRKLWDSRAQPEQGMGWIPANKKEIAEEAFDFYQTYGLPLEFYLEEAVESFGMTPFFAIAYEENNPDEIGDQEIKRLITYEFNTLKQKHAQKSRQASKGMFKGGLQDSSEQTTKYHTATHLLHAALRNILGDSVEQKGSNITAKRLRFDFSFSRALTEEEKQKVEDQINNWIKQDLPVIKQEMEKQEALDKGALAFFVDKYPDKVTVYTIGSDPENDWISKELCGGPHVASTGKIGKLKITKEKSASAGVRRVYVEESR